MLAPPRRSPVRARGIFLGSARDVSRVIFDGGFAGRAQPLPHGRRAPPPAAPRFQNDSNESGKIRSDSTAASPERSPISGVGAKAITVLASSRRPLAE